MVTIQKHVLYKYRSFDRKGHGLNMLKKAEIWLPSARSFNDPFDSAFTYDLDGLDGPIAEKWIRSALNKHVPHLSPTDKEKWGREYSQGSMLDVKQVLGDNTINVNTTAVQNGRRRLAPNR